MASQHESQPSSLDTLVEAAEHAYADPAETEVQLDELTDELADPGFVPETSSDDQITSEHVEFMSEQRFEELKDFIDSRAEDGKLTQEEIDEIIGETKSAQSSNGWLTQQQRAELNEYARERTADALAAQGKKVPWPLRIAAIFMGIVSLVSLLSIVIVAFFLFLSIQEGNDVAGQIAEEVTSQLITTEIVLAIISLVVDVVGFFFTLVLTIRLARNKRAGAARTIRFVIVLDIISIILQTMAVGIDDSLITHLITLAVLIALGVYLNPSLAAERKLRTQLRDLDTENRAKTGTLGLDLEGKGYIRLDFFNLFWIFVVGSVLGLIVEILWHMIVVDPGVYQDRAGLLYGPFSPIYGVGALLMTVALNRFKKANIILIFVACTIIGGAFEFFVSYWMETAFGIIAWNYDGYVLGDLLGGRTCLMFASMFGLLGVLWIKVLLPILLKLINKIPWKVRYVVTTVCAVLMLVDCVMTVQALDCWYEREAGKPVTTTVQTFYAEHYDNEMMQGRFQTMDLDPSRAARK